MTTEPTMPTRPRERPLNPQPQKAPGVILDLSCWPPCSLALIDEIRGYNGTNKVGPNTHAETTNQILNPTVAASHACADLASAYAITGDTQRAAQNLRKLAGLLGLGVGGVAELRPSRAV